MDEDRERRLEEAYGEMAEELRAEAADWDPASHEAWERAYGDPGPKSGRKP